MNQPDESRCPKSLLYPLFEHVGSSRSTEKLQSDVHNSIQLISKYLISLRSCVPAVAEQAAKRYQCYSRMLRGTSLLCYTPGLGEDRGEG